MKPLLLAIFISVIGAPAFSATTEKQCVEQKDAKTNKTKQVCKEIKIHKKLEGTKVPGK